MTTYLGELSPAPLRGRYTNWATTAAYAGFAVVPFIARGLVPNLASGWRILFGGALSGVSILFMRRGSGRSSMPPSGRRGGRSTGARRLALFVAAWFVYYISNYRWLTLTPTLFVDKAYSLAGSTTYLLLSGVGYLAGDWATTRFSDRLERKYTIAIFAVAWAISLPVIGLSCRRRSSSSSASSGR